MIKQARTRPKKDGDAIHTREANPLQRRQRRYSSNDCNHTQETNPVAEFNQWKRACSACNENSPEYVFAKVLPFQTGKRPLKRRAHIQTHTSHTQAECEARDPRRKRHSVQHRKHAANTQRNTEQKTQRNTEQNKRCKKIKRLKHVPCSSRCTGQ